MNDDFLKYYHQELAFLRESGKYFAKKHPEVAAQLGLGIQANNDPAVAQLLQSMALISAKLQQQLDDIHKPITNHLLDILHPHLFKPFPACAILQFHPSQNCNQIKTIPQHSPIKLQHSKRNCHFQTIYETWLWPTEVCSVTFKNIQNSVNPTLSILLKNTATPMTSLANTPNRIRFYIHADPHYAYAIYELILLRSHQVSINGQPGASVEPVGLNYTERVAPSQSPASVTYPLFVEFFAFPEKFLFFDVVSSHLSLTTETVAIDIALDHRHHYSSLKNYLNQSHLRVNCVPIVNLFTQIAEPICKNVLQTDYHLIADHQLSAAEIEIYDIRRVETYSSNGSIVAHSPLFTQHYSHQQTPFDSHWQVIRKPCWQLLEDKSEGSEIILRFIEHPEARTEGITRIETVCTNRNLPYQLSLESDSLTFQCQHPAVDEVESISCLVSPTPTRYLDLHHDTKKRYALLSNHPLSFYSQSQSLEKLKSLLQIHQYAPQHTQLSILESILSLKISALHHPAKQVYHFDTIPLQDIQLTVDTKLVLPGLWAVLGMILNQYFRHCANINSFTQFSLIQKNGEVFYPWNPLSGTHHTL